MLHQFGCVDLYAHEGVTFPRPYVDEWDNMAGLYNNVHPLVWSKERAGWLTAHGDTIEYIPRPAPGASYSGLNPIPIFFNTSSAANRKAIAIGLSQNAPAITNENAFYFVEARRNTSANFDNSLPGTGVLVYYVNQLIPQGEGPVILRDKNLLTPGLADAFFSVGDVVTIPGTGITLTVLAGSGGAAFNIRVDYTAPVTDYNVFITRGDTIDGKFKAYMSPDIWIDSPKNGFNLGGGPPPHNKIENPVAKVVNRIYARVHNDGPATAFDFDVRFRISEPYHTVGGEADFDTFVGIKHVDSLAAGSETILFAEWTPQDDDKPHACVMVDLINLVGTDTNQFDNWAQENLKIVASVTSSPFHPVASSFNLDESVRSRGAVLLPRRRRAEGVEGRSQPAQDPAEAGPAHGRRSDDHAAAGRQDLHERVHSDHELDRARRHAHQRGRRCGPGGSAQARRHHARSRRRPLLGQGLGDPDHRSQEAGQESDARGRQTPVRTHCRQRLHAPAATQSGDHPEVRRSAGQRDVPHCDDGRQRVLRRLRGQRHRRYVAGHRGVSRRPLRSAGDGRPGHRLLVPLGRAETRRDDPARDLRACASRRHAVAESRPVVASPETGMEYR